MPSIKFGSQQFLSHNKILCSLSQLSLVRVTLFCERDQTIFGNMKSFMCHQCEQGYKNGKLVTTTFPNTFLQTPKSML